MLGERRLQLEVEVGAALPRIRSLTPPAVHTPAAEEGGGGAGLGAGAKAWLRWALGKEGGGGAPAWRPRGALELRGTRLAPPAWPLCRQRGQHLTLEMLAMEAAAAAPPKAKADKWGQPKGEEGQQEEEEDMLRLWPLGLLPGAPPPPPPPPLLPLLRICHRWQLPHAPSLSAPAPPPPAGATPPRLR